MATSPQSSCLGNPMDRRAWWATVHGILSVGHDVVTNLPTSVTLCFTSAEIAKLFQSGCTILQFQQECIRIQFFHIFNVTWPCLSCICRVWGNTILWLKICIFLMTNGINHFLGIIDHLYIFFGKVSQVFCPYNNSHICEICSLDATPY